MKKVMSLCGLALLVAGPTYAADGRLTVNGQVVSTTCEIGDFMKDLVVDLAPIGTNTLPAAGAEAGKKPFVIIVAGCSEQERVGVAFEVAEGTSTEFGTLPNVAPIGDRAGNVDIALYNNGNGVDRRINLSDGSSVAQMVQTNGGIASLVYAAGYYATGVATAGAVKSVATFSITYQ
ncbi:MAG: type 1 fimbrial protein [Neisseriaceae bacterium]|nr:type 1 fimbrial protein [Neisseriaceae bacterium]MBP6862963.1 type 1 fimbrial protein [Neisseriaceae bacterium]